MFSKRELIVSQIVLVTLKEWLVLRIKLNYSERNVGVKVEPHTPSILLVFPTQMLQYLRFVWVVVFVVHHPVSVDYTLKKQQQSIRCFNTRYFAFNFNRQLPDTQIVTRDCGLR